MMVSSKSHRNTRSNSLSWEELASAFLLPRFLPVMFFLDWSSASLLGVVWVKDGLGEGSPEESLGAAAAGTMTLGFSVWYVAAAKVVFSASLLVWPVTPKLELG